MYIKDIELRDFRNYRDIKVSFGKNINIFIGSNAQGKTNLLEAIYMNSMARSFKTSRDRELVRFGEDFCRIKTTALAGEDEYVTEIAVNREGKKAVKINGCKIKKTSELLERIYIIIFSPEDLKIVKEGPEKRRRFMDRELCQIKTGYYMDLGNYRRALRQRNAFLKEDEIETSILDIWDMELAKYGSRITRERKRFLKKTDKISAELHGSISGGKEKLSLRYEQDSPEEEKEFLRILREERSDDIKNRNTSRGPHKDDFSIMADNIDLRKFGSQGQQRTAALSLKLSEIKIIEKETGERPILLLDDVLSELDNERQVYLINSLGENQLFITTADLSGKVVRQLPQGKIFKIKGGEIEIEI